MNIKTLNIYKSKNKPVISIITGVTLTNVYVDELSFDLVSSGSRMTRVKTSYTEKEYGMDEFKKLIDKGFMYLCEPDLIDILEMLSPTSWTREAERTERDPNPDPFKKYMSPPETVEILPQDLSKLDIP